MLLIPRPPFKCSTGPTFSTDQEVFHQVIHFLLLSFFYTPKSFISCYYHSLHTQVILCLTFVGHSICVRPLPTMHILSYFLCAAALCQATSAQSSNTVFTTAQQHQLSFDPLAIAYARVDPIVSHGVNTTSSHAHTLVGPNVLNSNSTGDQLRTGTCTSMDLGSGLPDLSAYVLILFVSLALCLRRLSISE